MEPVTIIGTLSAAGTIVAGITSVVHDLTRLKERFKEADNTIGLLLTELNTIKGALSQVEHWIKFGAKNSPVQEELAGCFEISMEGCKTAVSLLSERVAALHAAFISEEHAFLTRAKAVWNESALKDHQQHLRSQVQALQFLIQVVQIRSLPGQAAELRQPANARIIAKMKDDTSSLRAMARSSRCETDSVVTRTESSIGSRIFPFDQEVVESGPYRSNGALATERHRTNILRTGSSACDTRDRTERYTSQIGFNRDYRSASPRQELAERQFALRVSKSRDDRNKTYARGTRFVLSGDVSENLTRGARPERHVSDPVLAPHLSDLSNSHHDVKGRHQGSVQDSSSTADSQLTSPTINVQDTEPSRTEYSASPVDQWGLPSSSQGSLTLDTLERSPSRYSWRAEPFADNVLPASPQLSVPAKNHAEKLGLWGTIKRHPSVAKFPIFSNKSKSPLPLSPVSPTPGSRRGRVRSENDIHRSVDFKQESLPALIEAVQDGGHHEVEHCLDQGAQIEAATSMTRRTALAVAAHCGKEDVAGILLRRGANIEAKDITGMMPLHLAADRGHIGVVALLLSWDAAVDCETPSRKTPLRLAADNGRHAVAQLLLGHHARVNSRDRSEFTALHAAAQGGDAEMVNLLIAHNADLEARDAEGMAAIHYAAQGGYVDIVESFLSKKVHVDYTGKSEMTPLMIACSTGKTEMARLLVKRKANTRHKSDHDMTALHWACFHGQRDIVELLIQRKVAIDAQTSDGRTPLQIAILSKSFDTVEYLLRNKASIEASCAQAWRPIHYACKVADGKIVDLLLGRKANVESSNNAGQRSLHIATIQGSLDVVKKLLDKNASIDCLDETGERPLTLAVLHGHLDIMQALLSRGAALRLKFKQGYSHEDSPMCIAAREGHYEIVLGLIKKGASVGQTDERGWQPLRYAAYYGHPEITEALLQHGASVSALNLGAHGISTSARIGFAHDVRDDRRSQIKEILETAEAIELSQQQIAERTQYPVRNGLVEMGSSAASERANIPPLASPQRTPTALQSGQDLPSQPHSGTQYSQSRVTFPLHNFSHFTATSSGMSSPASVASDFSGAAALRPSSEAYQQSQSMTPRRTQTTRPRSNLSGIHSVDDVYGGTTGASTSLLRSISAATPRAAPPVRAPPPPPLQQRTQTPPPAYFSPALPMPQTDSALPQDAEISIEERQQVLRLTCVQCIRSGQQTPDFSCVSCRNNVFRYNHNSQQTAPVIAALHSNEDEEEPRMQHTSGPVYEMYVPGVLKN